MNKTTTTFKLNLFLLITILTTAPTQATTSEVSVNLPITAEKGCGATRLAEFYNETAADAESPLSAVLIRAQQTVAEGENVSFKIYPRNIIQAASSGIRGEYSSTQHIYVMAGSNRYDEALGYFKAYLVQDDYDNNCRMVIKTKLNSFE